VVIIPGENPVHINEKKAWQQHSKMVY
jgi:hypothetical protein